MRRATKLLICILVILGLLVSSAGGAGFTQNGDLIEEATKSVLMIGGPQIKDSSVYSLGSGFVAFNSSTLITNYHVIDGVSSLFAIDDEDHFYMLEYVLCADKEADIAILEFSEPTNLKPLELYPDDQLKRGSPVVAIGSPDGGEKNTVTTGVVSSQFTEENTNTPMIQISAFIYHGSSGGALFNDDGKVIGVTSSGYETRSNLNFAVNIAVAQAMYNAWDGTRSTFSNHKTSAKMDYTGVYDHSAAAVGQSNSNAEQGSGDSNQVSEHWTCPTCGRNNTDRFCLECGTEKPVWVCVCGRTNSSKFCGSCGRKAADLVVDFNNAMLNISEQKFEEAIQILTDLGDYDSGSYATMEGAHVIAKDYISKVYYDWGTYLVSVNGEHEAILDKFEKAGGFEDASEQIDAENDRYYGAFYTEALKEIEKGEYLSAIELLGKAGDYSDAKDKIRSVYYLWGLDLLEKKEYDACREKLKGAGEYEDSARMILKSYYEEGLACEDSEKAIVLLTKAGDYPGAKEQIELIREAKRAAVYDDAIKLYNDGAYTDAEELFEKLPGYKDADNYAKLSAINIIRGEFSNHADKTNIGLFENLTMKLDAYLDIDEAKELRKEIMYKIGSLYSAVSDYPMAISYFEAAGDYLDASQLAMNTSLEYFDSLLDNRQYDEANSFLQEKLIPNGYMPDKIMLQPGDTGEISQFVLGLVRSLGFDQKIPQDETEYKEQYVEPVQKLEEYFGFTADGKIYLDEYAFLQGLIYKGASGDRVQKFIEKMLDLGYYANLGYLDHTTYVNGYFNATKNAEKDMGLTVDGIITPDEFDAFMAKGVELDKPENVKVRLGNNAATVTWDKVQGALGYRVYNINGDLLGETKDTKLVIKNVGEETQKGYVIEAYRYTVSCDSRRLINYVSKDQTGAAGSINKKVKIGINFLPVTNRDIENGWPCKGLLVMDVQDDGPADSAGMLVGDIIVQADGKDIKSMDDFSSLLSKAKAGQVITFIVQRPVSFEFIYPAKYSFEYSNQLYEIKVQLAENRGYKEKIAKDTSVTAKANPKIKVSVGINYYPITNRDLIAGWPYKGLLIVEVVRNSPAFRAGIRAGDIITKADGTSITSVEDLSTFLESVVPDQVVRFTVKHASTFKKVGELYTFDYTGYEYEVDVKVAAK